MLDFMPDIIDFMDEKQHECLRDKIYSAIQDVLKDEKNTLERLEDILFIAQSWIQPFIREILSFESMHLFSGLENAFSYIKDNQQKRTERPYPKLAMYCEMCNQVGCIVDSHDDPIYLESIHLSQETAARLGQDYFSELEGKDSVSRTYAFYSYSIFESYYYFIDYFIAVKERNHAIKNCLFLIDNILFNVLWYLDCDLGNHAGNSYFLRAVNELFSREE